MGGLISLDLALGKKCLIPHGFDQSDYYDEINTKMKREGERKELKQAKEEFHNLNQQLS